jgi:ribosomal protein L7/L12
VEENDSVELPAAQVEAIREALFRGNKIEAIKLCRDATQLGLAESKAFIEAVELRLRQQEPEQFSSASAQKAGCAGMIMLAGVLSTAACWCL